MRFGSSSVEFDRDSDAEGGIDNYWDDGFDGSVHEFVS